MKKRIIAVTSVLGIILSGCIPTLHPVYTDGDLMFEKLLIGVWQPVDEVSTWDHSLKDGLAKAGSILSQVYHALKYAMDISCVEVMSNDSR